MEMLAATHPELPQPANAAEGEAEVEKPVAQPRSVEERMRIAAMEGDLAAVRSCLRLGASGMCLGGEGEAAGAGQDDKTALHLAAQNGHLAVAQLLVSESKSIAADVGRKTAQGLTALHYAAHGGHREIVGLLLDHNADVSENDGEGWTPLHHSCSRGYQEVAELLLKRNADVAVRTARGNTALKLGKNYRDLHQTLKLEHELRDSKFFETVKALRDDFNDHCIERARLASEVTTLKCQVRESEAHYWHCNDRSLAEHLREFARASDSVSSVSKLVETLSTFMEEQRSSQQQIDGFSDLVAEIIALEKAKTNLKETFSEPRPAGVPSCQPEMGSPLRQGIDVAATVEVKKSDPLHAALSDMNQLREKCKAMAEELEGSWKATAEDRTSADSLTRLFEGTRDFVVPALPGGVDTVLDREKRSLTTVCEEFLEWRQVFEQSRVGSSLNSLRGLAVKMSSKLEETSKWQEGEDEAIVTEGTRRMAEVLSTVAQYLDEMRPSWKELNHMQERTETYALQMTEECRQQEQIEQHLAQLESFDEQILDLEQLADDAEYHLRKLQRNRRRSAIPEDQLAEAIAARDSHQRDLMKVKRMKRVLCNKLWRFLQMGHKYLKNLYDFVPASSFVNVPSMAVNESMDDYEVVKFLDASGTIRLCRARGDDDGDLVILKQLAIGSAADAKKFEQEVSILATLNHPFLCSLLGIIVHDDSLAFVKLPYYSGGTLQEWLTTAERGEEEVSVMFQRILQGLAYLHSRGIVHRDVKPTNVVLGASGDPHIIDFGVSKETGAGQLQTTTLGSICGTQGFISPEVLQGESPAAPADLWAFGVMLYTAQFKEVVAADQLALCKQLRFPRTMNHLLRSLLEGLLSISPAERLTAEAALAHPYFCRDAVKDLEDDGRLPLTVDKLTALREHIHALYNYESEWHIDVDREHMVSNVLRSFSASDFTGETLYRKTVVRFVGEPGWDAGGLQKELYCHFFEQVCSPAVGLFESRGNSCYMPLPGSHTPAQLRKYEAVGRVLAKALLDEALVGGVFGNALFKLLIGKESSIGLSDLEEFDPQMAASLQKVLAYTGPIADFDLAWDLPKESGSIVTDFTEPSEEHPADDGSEQRGEEENSGLVPVTDGNKKQYVALKSTHVLVGSRKPALDAIASGFSLARLDSHLSLLSGMELQLLLCGKEYMDGDMVMKEIKFRNFPSTSIVPKACEAWLRSLSVDDLHCFLMYCTGQGSIPVGGFVPRIKFFLGPDMTPAHLPRAQTCFNAITVPDYPSEALLVARFKAALANLCSGFQLT